MTIKSELSVWNMPTGDDLADNVSFMDIYTGGEVIYVSSTHPLTSNSNPGTFARPVSSLAQAMNMVTANVGDMIVLMPNHAETITGVGGLAFDVAGVTVLGMGTGKQRPRFLMDGADTVTAAVTAADTRIVNVEFAAGHADVTQCFDVQATGFTLERCVFTDNVAGENFLNIVLSGTATDNVADDIALIGNRWYSPDAAALSFWEHTGDVRRAMVVGNNVHTAGTGATAAFIFSTSGDDLNDATIAFNTYRCETTGDNSFIENDTTANTGMIAWNVALALDADAAVPLDADGLAYMQNFYSGDIAASGLLLPAADS